MGEEHTYAEFRNDFGGETLANVDATLFGAALLIRRAERVGRVQSPTERRINASSPDVRRREGLHAVGNALWTIIASSPDVRRREPLQSGNGNAKWTSLGQSNKKSDEGYGGLHFGGEKKGERFQRCRKWLLGCQECV